MFPRARAGDNHCRRRIIIKRHDDWLAWLPLAVRRETGAETRTRPSIWGTSSAQARASDEPPSPPVLNDNVLPSKYPAPQSAPKRRDAGRVEEGGSTWYLSQDFSGCCAAAKNRKPEDSKQ
jgi:hypothetical protein